MHGIHKALLTGFSSAFLLSGLTIPALAHAFSFSGYEWDLKDSGSTPVGPGPNVFSGNNVSIDSQGRLHMFIRRVNGVWTSSELILRNAIGYGSYTMVLATPLDAFHSQAVFGFFTWSTPDLPTNNEVDIEVARFSTSRNLYHSVQPSTRSFSVGGAAWSRSQHTFVWSPGNVSFSSIPLGYVRASSILSRFRSGVPTPSGTTFPRLNFWLCEGRAPAGVQTQLEVIIERVEFVPA